MPDHPRYRVLLTESSSASAREVLTVLARQGHRVDVMDSGGLSFTRYSRWVRRRHRAPAFAADPLGHLDALRRVLREHRYDVLLPTHEQLVAIARHRDEFTGLVGGLAVPDFAAVRRVQDKAAAVRLLADLGLPQPDTCLARDPAELVARTDRLQHLLDGHRQVAAGGVVAAHRVAVGAVQLRQREAVHYQRVVIATGRRARSVPALSGPGVVTLRTVEDADRIRPHLRAGSRLVIIGGGLVGCEVASTAAAMGTTVDLVSDEELPVTRAFGAEIGRRVRDIMAESPRVIFHPLAKAVGIERSGDGTVVGLADGRELHADLVLLAVGGVPNTEWLGSGLRIDDGVLCDDRLVCDDEGRVHAVGDVARRSRGRTEPSVRVEHWTNAGSRTDDHV